MSKDLIKNSVALKTLPGGGRSCSLLQRDWKVSARWVCGQDSQTLVRSPLLGRGQAPACCAPCWFPWGASSKAMAPLPAQTKLRESLWSGCKQAEATAPIASTSAGSRTGFCSFPSQTGPPTVQLFLLLGLVLQMKQAERMQCYRFASYKEMSLWKPNPNWQIQTPVGFETKSWI